MNEFIKTRIKLQATEENESSKNYEEPFTLAEDIVCEWNETINNKTLNLELLPVAQKIALLGI